MKKAVFWMVTIYVIYAAAMALYLFKLSPTGVPDAFQGTPADPKVFMTDRELLLSQEYSRIQYWLRFISIPLEWLMYAFILMFGFSRWLRNRSLEMSRFNVIQISVFVLSLNVVTWAVMFPIDWISYRVSVDYGISVQSAGDWFRDSLISFWINAFISIIMIGVVYWLIRRQPRKWWLTSWALSIPFMLFLMFIQPVVIDPLYDEIKPLENQSLKNDILNLAEEADIPAEDVYEINKSETTNAMNAYVNGIGANLRIVLWDTTLNNLSKDQVLFIMAHEIGHYVMNHLTKTLIGTIFSMLVGLYIAARLFKWAIRRWGDRMGINRENDMAALPMLLLIFSLLTFVASPVENAISRVAEANADDYAVELTENAEAGIDAYQKLTANGLSEVNPPTLVKWMFYSHPTMLERITELTEEGQLETTSKSK